MAQPSKKHTLVNGLGGLFYAFTLLQWLWAALPYLPGLISFATKLQPDTSAPTPVVVHTASTQPPSILMVLLASVIVVGMLAMTAYVLIKLPITIGKTGEKLTKGASHYIVPVISHHTKLTPKKRLQLTTRTVLIVKFALCVTPAVIVVLSFNITSGISYNITLIVAAFLATIALLLLGSQLLLARLLKIPIKDSW
jgi:hypothetical protein